MGPTLLVTNNFFFSEKEKMWFIYAKISTKINKILKPAFPYFEFLSRWVLKSAVKLLVRGCIV